MPDNQQLTDAQHEALRILAAVMKSGAGFQRAAIEAEMTDLDDASRPAVLAEIQRLFDSMIGIKPGEAREPVPGVTLSGLTSPRVYDDEEAMTGSVRSRGASWVARTNS